MSTYQGKQYRLRAGSPMPTSTRGNFVLHSFMAASSDVEIDTCTKIIVGAGAFQGQGGGLTSASYTGLPLSSTYFTGKTTSSESFISEIG